jgi:GT2 family glycosyltransferase
MQKFSIVIPSLHAPLIDKVIAALEAQTARDQIQEIIVVGQDRHQLVPPSVTFLRTERPLSAAAARNRGAQAAAGDIILFIDSDCVAAPDLVERLLARHAAGHLIVGGSIAPGNDDYWMQCDHMLVFADYLPSTRSGQRPFLPSGNCSIRRDLFLALGGFDPQFPGAAGEEVDLCLRLREQGHVLFFDPQARVDHCHPRISAAIIWNHLRRFGQVHVTQWQRHPQLLPAPLGGKLRLFSGLLLALSPLLSLWDVVGIFAVSPALLPSLHLMPGMVWARMAWYWGVTEAILVQP